MSAAPVPANENALRKALVKAPRVRGYFEALRGASIEEGLAREELDEVLAVLREARR